MELRLNITDLQNPNDIVTLKRALSTMADECDVLYSETAPNGSISARIGRRCVYNNSGTITYWVNTDGSTTWRQLTDSANEMWVVDGTETQLRTADEIDMQSKKIINVTDPASDQDAATKKYHDDDISAKMNTSTGHDHDGSDSKKIPVASIDAAGTPSSSNFLRGDGAWGIPTVPALTLVEAKTITNGSNSFTFSGLSPNIYYKLYMQFTNDAEGADVQFDLNGTVAAQSFSDGDADDNFVGEFDFFTLRTDTSILYIVKRVAFQSTGTDTIGAATTILTFDTSEAFSSLQIIRGSSKTFTGGFAYLYKYATS